MQSNGICSCKFVHSDLSEGSGGITIAQDKPKDKHTFGVTGRRPELIKVCSNTFQVIFLFVVHCVRHEFRGLEILLFL